MTRSLRDLVLPALLPAAFLAATALEAGCQSLLRDLNTDPGVPSSSSPQVAATVGPRAFFFATTTLGTELHVTDGSVRGTRLVADLVPGPDGCLPLAATALDGTRVVFQKRDGNDTPREVWVSDGTAAGTRPLHVAASTSSTRFTQMALAGGRVFFVGETTAAGIELWSTNGTAAGTSLVADVLPGPGSSSPEQLVALGGRILFVALSPTAGRELHVTDGTAAGTRLVADLAPGVGSSGVTSLVANGGTAYFTFTDGSGAWFLGCSDGTAAGTRTIGPVPGPQRGLAAFRGGVAWTAYPHLYVFDGAQSLGTVPLGGRVALSDIVVANDLMFCPGLDTNRQLALLVSDGTAAGTRTLSGIVASQLSTAGIVGRELWFAGADAASGQELYRTDGTQITRIADIEPGPASSSPVFLATLAGGRALVRAGTSLTGIEPWITDGTPPGTNMLVDLLPTRGTGSSNPTAFVDATATTVFTAFHGAGLGFQLWSSDGTANGTQLVEPTSLRTSARLPVAFGRLGNEVLYIADDATTGREPWITDGTPGDARPLGDLSPGTGFTRVTSGVESGGRFFGAAVRTNARPALFLTDGTPAGTSIVDLPAQPIDATFAAMRGGVFFAGLDAQHGAEPWFTDGTVAGTVLLGDLAPGTDGAVPALLGALGDTVVFRAWTPTLGAEPWITDGTPRGTRLLADLTPGTGSSNPFPLADDGTRLWFSKIDTGDLMVTDGTATGTRTLHAGCFPQRAAAIAQGVVYAYLDARGNTVLALHDGNRRQDLLTGRRASQVLAGADGRAYATLQAFTGEHEIWATDGSTAGTTRLVASVWNVPPLLFTSHRGRLFYRDADESYGFEPHVIPLSAAVDRVGRGCGSAGRSPRLDADHPLLGRTLRITGRDAAPRGAAFLVLGTVARRPVAVPGTGCSWLVGPVPFAVLGNRPVATDGTWQAPALPLPDTSALLGFEIAAQTAFATPAGRLELSDALHLHLGR